VRGPSQGDGLPGPITYLDTSLINIDRTNVTAFDSQLDYSITKERLGDFNFYLVATYQKEYSKKLTVVSPEVNSVGYFDGPLKWRGNAGITWQRGPFALGWNMQYFDSYLVYKIVDGGRSIDMAIEQQGSRTIPSQHYHDLSFRYNIGSGALSKLSALDGVSISGGIQNVLNTSPPIETGFLDVGYSRFGDPRLRRYSLEVTKSF
jgi:iron complex outermembrane receptor protein